MGVRVRAGVRACVRAGGRACVRVGGRWAAGELVGAHRLKRRYHHADQRLRGEATATCVEPARRKVGGRVCACVGRGG